MVARAAAVAMLLGVAASMAGAQTLFYNGQWDGVYALGSGIDGLQRAYIYDDFIVTAAGWNVTGVFGDFLVDATFSTANYEIRSGLSNFNGGSLLFSGSGVAATQTATGQSGFGMNEYRVDITTLSFFLAPGTYWLGIQPVGSLQRCCNYVVTTSGLNGINADLDKVFFYDDPWATPDYRFQQNYAFLGNPSDYPYDLAYGVEGQTASVNVTPEPGTVGLLATGLVGLLGFRRSRKRIR